jgi:RNA polymerase sigma factor (sigma-70 family)
MESSPVLQRYFAEIRNEALLSHDEERGLAERSRTGDRVAMNQLIERNLTFVVRVAKEYRNLGVPFEDLLNEGNLGLIEAARRFDPERGTRFITWAVWWIRKHILRAVSTDSGVVRVPEYHSRRARRLAQTERAAHMPRRAGVVSLDRGGDDGEPGEPLHRRLLDPDAPNAELDLLQREAIRLVGEAVRALTERERTVICGRFGLEGGAPRALQEIGAEMGLSRERVRQIENRAKSRLRRMLLRRHAPLWAVDGGSAVAPSRPAGSLGIQISGDAGT